MIGAQIVGLDRSTDLAVLKISGANLSFMELGDSEDLQPGEAVMTFGNPMGLENTVTFGVISAVARQLRPDDPMIHIQTDAAINPGNSGGPLVNMQGQVIGINTFILSQSGGSEGLGFAAPSNIVKNVFNQIRTTGQMRRGVIGVNAQTITPMMAEALVLPRTWGVILGDVYPNGPAASLGLKAGDIILSLDGKIMENGRQLQVNLYGRHIGDSVTLEVLRGTETLTIRVPVVEQADDPGRFAGLVTPERNLISKLGVLALELNENIAKMIPFLRLQEGIVVAATSASTMSGGTGFLPGDVIHSVNGEAMTTLDALRNAVDKLETYTPIALHLERQGQMQYVILEIE
jgi:serine protease Do